MWTKYLGAHQGLMVYRMHLGHIGQLYTLKGALRSLHARRGQHSTMSPASPQRQACAHAHCVTEGRNN